MKKIFFFTYFHIFTIQEFVKNKLKNEEKNFTLISEQNIEAKIKTLIQDVNDPDLKEENFLDYEYTNKIILNIKKYKLREKILFDLHALRRSIYLLKINEKKQKTLNTNDITNLFIHYNLLHKLEPLVHNYIFSVLLDPESLVETLFVDLSKENCFRKKIKEIKCIFQKNSFFPLLVNLICAQVNSFSSTNMFLENKNDTLKIYDLKDLNNLKVYDLYNSNKDYTLKIKDLDNSSQPHIISKKLYAKLNEKQNDEFNKVFFELIKDLNNKSRYPISYNQQTLTEQDLFNQVLSKIIFSFSEQYIEEINFDTNILETFLLLETPKKEYMTTTIAKENLKNDNTREQNFFNNAQQKGKQYLVCLNNQEKPLSQSITKNNQNKQRLTKYDYCILGGTIFLISVLYIKKMNKIDHL